MTDALSRTQGFEGTRLRPYLDCCGKLWRECDCTPQFKGNLTIGVGVNLDEGISAVESYFLFSNRMAAAKEALNYHLPYAAARLNDPRYAVLWDMSYNLGIGRLLGFKKMLEAIRREDWQKAHDELLDSVYAGQVGIRAEKNAQQILMGEWV